MKRLSSIIVGISGLLLFTGAANPSARDISPFDLYGDRISFTVLRNGGEVGTHEVRFKRKSGNLVVTSQFDLRVRALVIDLYKYNYTSVARWSDGVMVQLNTDVYDNGEKSRVEARGNGKALAVATNAGQSRIKGPILPTTHWNPGVLSSSRVLNTITGQVNNVRIAAVGKERVETERGTAMATKYRYSGDLQTEAWYDTKGRWVKLRFKAEDGSTIEFKCKKCLG